MAILTHILQYSNDGNTVEKETFLNQDEDCIEGLLDLIDYHYDTNRLEKCEQGFISEWYRVDVKNYPYNRLLLRIEETEKK